MDNSNFQSGTSLSEALKQRSLTVIVVETLFYSLTVLVALIGNTCVLLAVYRNPRLRTVPNYYIASLAISDILLPLLCAPCSMAVFVLGYWPFSDNVCQVQGYFVMILAFVSLQVLALTAINRFYRMSRTNRYRSLFSKKNTVIMIASSCVIACMEPLPYLLTGRRYVFHPGKRFCFQTLEVSGPNVLVYAYVGVPMFTLCLCYVLVFYKIRAHQRTVQSLRSASLVHYAITKADLKVTKILFVTVLGFLSCWTPISVIDLIDIFRGKTSFPPKVYVIYFFLGNLSGVFNPLIYGMLNRNFREEYRTIFTFKKHRSSVRQICLSHQNH